MGRFKIITYLGGYHGRPGMRSKDFVQIMRQPMTSETNPLPAHSLSEHKRLDAMGVLKLEQCHICKVYPGQKHETICSVSPGVFIPKSIQDEIGNFRMQVLDEVLGEIKQLSETSLRLNAYKTSDLETTKSRVFGYADALSDFQEIIERLKNG